MSENSHMAGHANYANCQDCLYLNTPERRGNEGGCLYCLTTGRARLMPIESCTLWTPKSPKAKRRMNPMIAEPPPREKKGSIPHGSAMSLWREGKNDKEIAEELKASPSGVRSWRLKHGLPSNYRNYV